MAKLISHKQIFTIIYSPNGRFAFLVRYYKTIRSRMELIISVIKFAKAIYDNICIIFTIKILFFYSKFDL